MDILGLVIRKSKSEEWLVVDIVINGRRLVDILKEIELPFAVQEGEPSIAGAYQGLIPKYVFPPSRHFLDRPEPPYEMRDGRVAILECECGEPGCWPFGARIELTDERVVWKDFCQPYRSISDTKLSVWRYDTLGPFIFDRKQYEGELCRIRPDRTGNP